MAGAALQQDAKPAGSAPALHNTGPNTGQTKALLHALPTLAAFPRGEGVILYDYLTRRTLEADTDMLYWLSYFHDGATIARALKDHAHLPAVELKRELEALCAAGILVNKANPPSPAHGQYEQHWKMGTAAAMLHFATQNLTFKTLEDNQRFREERARTQPSPSLYWQDRGTPVTIAANAPSPASALLALMAKRRSNRNVLDEPITAQALMDCLLAGQGITGFVDSGTGLLPLTMTPSGGARNPFEAFVLVRQVSGLEAGLYHYEAVAHRLCRLPGETLPPGSSFVGGQDWADPMPAIIILVAVMERTTWKYEEPNAYRVILVEAGHIGQNMALAATAHGLTAMPTAALWQDNIRKALGLTDLSHAPVYTVSLGKPGAYDTEITPNEKVMMVVE